MSTTHHNIIKTLAYPTVELNSLNHRSTKKRLFNESFDMNDRDIFKKSIVSNMQNLKHLFSTTTFNSLAEVTLFFRYSEVHEFVYGFSDNQRYDYFMRFFERMGSIGVCETDIEYFVIPLLYGIHDGGMVLSFIKAMIYTYPDNINMLTQAFLLSCERYIENGSKDNRYIDFIKDDMMSCNAKMVISFLDPIQSPLARHYMQYDALKQQLYQIISDQDFKNIILDIGSDGFIDSTYMYDDDGIKKRFKTFITTASTKEVKFLIKALFINTKHHHDAKFIKKINTAFMRDIIKDIEQDDKHKDCINTYYNALKLLNI